MPDYQQHERFGVHYLRPTSHQGTFAYSVTCIVTRHGNPKGIHSFELLRAADAEVVYPDPTTSGGAQWAILALYGSALRESELASGSPDLVHARRLLKDISLSAGSLPESARRALTQFGLGYGDALLTYENEALLDLSKGKDYEIVIPKTTIYIEPKVLIIDRNVGAVEREVVEALVDYLWTSDAQDSLARNNFRVWDEAAMARYSDKFVEVEYPFTVEYLGGWERATSDIIERTWREIQREIN